MAHHPYITSMLADFLERAREQLLDDAQATADGRSAGRDPGDRRARLQALLDELIERLRHGAADKRGPVTSCESVEQIERQRLRRTVLAEVESRRLDVSLAEMVIVADWSSSVERRRLREENRRFSALLNAVDDGVMLLSLSGRTLYLNRRAAADIGGATGLSADDIIGKTSVEAGFPPDLTRPLEALIQRAVAGEIIAEDLMVPLENGRRWVDFKLTPVHRSDGAIGAVALVGRHIHERKLAQIRFQLLAKMSSMVGLTHEALLESVARLSVPELADWGAVYVVEGDEVRAIFLAQRDPGKEALRQVMARVPRHLARGEWWQELLAGRSVLSNDVSEAWMRAHSVDEEHFRLLQSVGLRSLLLVPIGSRGTVRALLTFATTSESERRFSPEDVALAEELAKRAGQILENARLSDEIKRSEMRFRVALTAGRIAVYEMDRSLRYRFVHSPQALRDAVGERHRDIFEPDDAARLDALKSRALAGEQVREEMELTVLGERRHYRQSIEPMRDDSGAIVGLIGAAIDITDEKQARLELQQAVSFREQMLGILGHDLRNPLSTITMAAAVLRRARDLPETSRSQALRIDRAARRMAEMIATLLDFAQARFRGALPVSPVTANLAEIARETVEELRVSWPGRQIGIELRGDPMGQWDPARIAQVISNLVANALNHGADGAPVRVLIDGDGAEARLTVHNVGPVIPSTVIATLFEPFRRGPEEHRARGVGLGLYIVRQIVQAHDGNIEVLSTPSDGTRFTVHLPRTVSVEHQAGAQHAVL